MIQQQRPALIDGDPLTRLSLLQLKILCRATETSNAAANAAGDRLVKKAPVLLTGRSLEEGPLREVCPVVPADQKGVGLPRGSKYPIFEVSGSKNHTLNGVWDQRPQILGTLTLWARSLFPKWAMEWGPRRMAVLVDHRNASLSHAADLGVPKIRAFKYRAPK